MDCQEIHVFRNSGRADGMKLQCFWISVRDYLNATIRPLESKNLWTVTALKKLIKSKVRSNQINSDNNMFDTSIHFPAMYWLSNLLEVQIRIWPVKHDTKSIDTEWLFKAGPDQKDPKKVINIISHGNHFELITCYQNNGFNIPLIHDFHRGSTNLTSEKYTRSGYKKISKDNFDLLENFNTSIVPILGFSQNQIIDVETETNQRIKKDFSSQFAGLNTSVSKKIDYDNKSNLTIEVNGTYGIHKLPKYLSNFTDGDLSVDDAVDQVLGTGFNVKYSKKNTKGFILEPYIGLSANKTVNNDVEIIADGESKEAGHVMNGVLAKKIGLRK